LLVASGQSWPILHGVYPSVMSSVACP